MPVAKNNTTVESEIVPISPVITEVLEETPIVKQENNYKVATSVKNTQNIGETPISSQIENTPKENKLTANVISSKQPINNKMVLGVFAGAIILLLVAKFIIKV